MKRDELIENIFDILNDEKLNHQNTTLGKHALWAMEIAKLLNIYNFLLQWVLSINDNQISQRPECPVKHVKQQNQATMWYKNNMVQYIEQFWLKLEWNPCSYTPGVLERIANQCDLILKKSW
jgi:hypothetical protein